MSDVPADHTSTEPVSQPAAPKKKRRWLKRMGCGGLVAVALVGISAITGVVFLMTPPGQAFIGAQVEGILDGLLTEGDVELGQFETNLVGYVHVEDVAIKDGKGRVVVGIDTLDADLDVFALLWGQVHVPRATIAGLHGDLQNDDAGQLDIARMFGAYEPADPNAEPFTGLPVDLELDLIEIVDSDIAYTDLIDVHQVNVSVGVSASGTYFDVHDIDVAGDMVGPPVGDVSVVGQFVWDNDGIPLTDLDVGFGDLRARVSGKALDLSSEGDLDLNLEVNPLDVSTIDAFVGAGLQGQYGGKIDAAGPLTALHVTGELAGLESTEGTLGVDMLVDTTVPSWQGRVSLEEFRVDHVAPSVGGETRISGEYTLDGSGATWPDGLQVDGRFKGHDLYVVDTAIDEIDVGVGLRNGTVVLTDLEATAESGVVTGGGIVDLRDGHMELTVTAKDVKPSALAQFQVPNELEGSLLASELTVSGELFEQPLRIGVQGQMVAAPFVWDASIRARRMMAWYEVDVGVGDEVSVVVTGDVSAWDMRAYGSEIGVAHSKGLRVEVDADGVWCSGSIEGADVVYPLPVDGLSSTLGELAQVDELTGTWRVDVPFTSDLVVDVDLEVGPHSLLRYNGERGVINVDMVGTQLDIVSALDAGPSRRLADVQSHLDLDTMRMSFARLQLAPTPKQTWTVAPGAAFVIDGMGVRDASMLALSSQGRLKVVGRAGMEGPLDLKLDVEGLRMEALDDLIPPWFGGLTGEVSTSMALGGDASRPTLNGVVTSDRLSMEGVLRELDLDLKVAGAARRMAVTGDVNVLGERLVTVDLDAGLEMAFDKAGLLPDDPLRGRLTLSPGRLARIREVAPIVQLPTGMASASVDLGGTMRRPTVDLGGVAELEVDGIQEAMRLEFGATREGKKVSVWADARRGMGRLATVRGGAVTRLDEVVDWALLGESTPDWSAHDLYAGELDVDVNVTNAPLATMVDALQVPIALHGRAGGVLHVGGSAMKPVLHGHIGIQEGRLATVALTGADLFVQHLDTGGYGVEFFADMEQPRRGKGGADLGNLSVTGAVPLELDFTKSMEDWVLGDLDLTILGDGVPLAVVSAFDSGVRNTNGKLQIEGFVRGHPFSPEPLLSARAEGVGLTYSPMRVRYDNVHLDVEATPKAITLRTLCMYTSKASDDGVLSDVPLAQVGSFLAEGVGRRGLKKTVIPGECPLIQPSLNVVGGGATLKDFSVTGLSGNAHLRQFLVLGTSDQHVEVSTAKPLSLSGDLRFPAVRGSINIDRADLYLDNVGTGGGASALDPRVVVHRSDGESVAAKAIVGSIFDDLDVDVAIDLGRNTRAKLIVPLEAVAFLGQGVSALTKMDLDARASGAITFKLRPCGMRDDDGKRVDNPAVEGACGLYVPEILGRTEIEEGKARIFQSEFDLADSALSFVGNEVYNPNLDLHGVMDAGGVEITMDIGGTAYNPEPVFESKDTDQVFVTLMLGRPVEDIDSQQLLMMMATMGLKSVLGGVNLGSVSIDPTGRVSMGFAVAPEVYVELRLASTADQDENQVEGAFEWTVVKGIVTALTAGDSVQALEILLEKKY